MDDGFAAAEDYLTLLFSRDTARGLVDRLRRENVQYFKVKDVLRAAHIRDVVSNVPASEKVVLLVRASSGLIVADGFEVVCAQALENKIPCKII